MMENVNEMDDGWESKSNDEKRESNEMDDGGVK